MTARALHNAPDPNLRAFARTATRFRPVQRTQSHFNLWADPYMIDFGIPTDGMPVSRETEGELWEKFFSLPEPDAEEEVASEELGVGKKEIEDTETENALTDGDATLFGISLADEGTSKLRLDEGSDEDKARHPDFSCAPVLKTAAQGAHPDFLNAPYTVASHGETAMSSTAQKPLYHACGFNGLPGYHHHVQLHLQAGTLLPYQFESTVHTFPAHQQLAVAALPGSSAIVCQQPLYPLFGENGSLMQPGQFVTVPMYRTTVTSGCVQLPPTAPASSKTGKSARNGGRRQSRYRYLPGTFPTPPTGSILAANGRQRIPAKDTSPNSDEPVDKGSRKKEKSKSKTRDWVMHEFAFGL